MIRNPTLLLGICVCFAAGAVRADIVTDWNNTLCHIAQDDGNNAVNVANPGWFTRAGAMENGAIYDVFQAFNRTNAPFLVNTTAAAGASLNAAVNQAAYEVLLNTYPGESTILNNDYNARMATISDGDKNLGIALGHSIAQTYISTRSTDHASDSVPYQPTNPPVPGHWQPDPFHPTQKAWGPEWGAVTPFMMPSSASFVSALTPPPALTSQAYTDAFNEVKSYGALNSAVRTTAQTNEALFWAYDRATMGPPPVIYDRNLTEIGAQVGNSPAQNARMFAIASVAMADAAIASWDAKFSADFWRPVTAIQQAATDGNANTTADPAWQPYGAPGPNPSSSSDDFTPPFPSWTSGHATMGSAMYQALASFFGTNTFAVAAQHNGVNAATYTLTSQEFDANGNIGLSRNFDNFLQSGTPDSFDVGQENSPEGEIAASRIYLGIHWIFDQRGGMDLGRSIGQYVFANAFAAVPEPAAALLALTALGGLVPYRQNRHKTAGHCPPLQNGFARRSIKTAKSS